MEMVFYFIEFVVYCCYAGKFISPLISELSEKYPHVTTHKIDIDQVGMICGTGNYTMFIIYINIKVFVFIELIEKSTIGSGLCTL